MRRIPKELGLAAALASAAIAAPLSACGSRTALDLFGGTALDDSGTTAPSPTAPAPASTAPSACTPPTGLTVLASGQIALSLLAVDANDIYWVNMAGPKGDSMSLMQLSLCGGTPVTLATGDFASLAVGTTNVAWSTADGTVMTVPVAGGTPVTLATQQDPDAYVAVDATNVYWACFNVGTVMKAPLGGGTPTLLAKGQGGGHPSAIALDDANVYWTSGGGGTVMKVPIAGGAQVTLASGQHGPVAMAVDATDVYWATDTSSSFLDGGAYEANYSGTLVRVALAGGPLTTLESSSVDSFEYQSTYPDSAPFEAFTVDATSVYWTERTCPEYPTFDSVAAPCSGFVMKAPLGGGAAATLAVAPLAGPGAIAVDATSVYWTEQTCDAGPCEGTITRLTPK